MKYLVWVAVLVMTLGCQAEAATGLSCSRDSECSASLVCRLGRCRTECTTNRDCSIPSRCLLDTNGLGSCSLSTDDRCESGGHTCPGGLVCLVDSCVNTCTTSADCPTDGVCQAVSASVSFCFSPDRPLPATDSGPVPHDAWIAQQDGGPVNDAWVPPLSDGGSCMGACAGDSCAAPVVLTANGSYPGSTVGYMDDYAPTCTSSTAPDVVYQITARADTTITVDLCNSDFDVNVTVGTSCGVASMCNDDNTHCDPTNPLGSYLSFPAVTGTTYYVVVDGHAGAGGQYQLVVSGY